MVSEIVKNLKKDLHIEFRSRIAVNIALAFAGIATLSISLASGGVPFNPQVQAILLWIIIFFTAMNGLAHIFVREEEEGTALFLLMNAHPDVIYFSKLIFNTIFFTLLIAIIAPLFIFFLQVEVHSYALLSSTLFSGGFAMASGTTILGAMVAKAGGKGSLFTVLSFPVLLPVIWIGIKTTTVALQGGQGNAYSGVLFLLAFSFALIIASSLIFKYLWSSL